MPTVTLYGGPHDGRRVNLPAVIGDRFRIHDDPTEDATEHPDPFAKPTSISVYRREVWADGPVTGPGSRHTRYWDRWQYEGPR